MRQLIVLLAALFAAQTSIAQFFNSARIYQDPDQANPHNGFGGHAALVGDRMMLVAGTRMLLYNPKSGSLIAEFTYPNPDSLPWSSDMSAAVIVAADSGYNPDAPDGSAYILDSRDGSFIAELVNPTPYSSFNPGSFGESVAASDNYVLVSDHTSYRNPGKVHVYDATDGTLLRTIENPPSADEYQVVRFGESIALSGDVAIVTAYNVGTREHRAHVIDVADGTVLRTLYPPPGSNFSGYTIDADGDRFAIAGYEEIVHVYQISTGNLLASFPMPDESQDIYDLYSTYGRSIALSGDLLMIGAGTWSQLPHESNPFGTIDEGRAWLFSVNGNSLVERLPNPFANSFTGGTNSGFGAYVALDGTTAVTRLRGGGGYGVGIGGRVYVYSEAFQVEIDIKPGDATNSVDNVSTANVEVAVLSTSKSAGDLVDFEAALADPASLRFGPGQVASTNVPGVFRDVGGDGDLDLVNEYKISELDLVCEQTEPLTLTGKSVWGHDLWGVDEVNTNDCPTCHP